MYVYLMNDKCKIIMKKGRVESRNNISVQNKHKTVVIKTI